MHWPNRLFVALLFLVMAACQSAEKTIPATAVQTQAYPLATTTVPLPTLTPFPTLIPTLTPSPVPSPSPTFLPTSTPQPLISLLFTGAIAPARCVQAAIDQHGNADYLYDEVRELFLQADLTIGTLNASVSDIPPKTGCKFTFVLVSEARNADAMAKAGIKVMSVATNHIKNCGFGDCGDRAFLDTLANLRRADILPVGAGNNLADAMQPVVVTIKGVRFGFISLGMVEPLAFATEKSPGIAVLNDKNLKEAIAATRQMSDVVIVLPHWGSDYGPNPNSYQLHFAKVAVAAGADLVVGNHPHVVQAVQTIQGVQVFYSLGSLVFDQTWSLETQQGVIVRVTFQGAHYQGYELIPTHVDGDGTVHIAGKEEAAQILTRIQKASQALIKTP